MIIPCPPGHHAGVPTDPVASKEAKADRRGGAQSATAFHKVTKSQEVRIYLPYRPRESEEWGRLVRSTFYRREVVVTQLPTSVRPEMRTS